MKMQQIAKTLVIFLLAITINACSSKLIIVPSGCNISNIDYPVLDLVDRNSTLGEAKRCAVNYTRYKEAFEKQRKIIDVCR